jgi:hypothetical protein
VLRIRRSCREAGRDAVGAAASEQYGDHTRIDLPHTGIAVQSATTWVEVAPDDRLAVPPDVPVALTAADYFADRDPAFQAALSP